MTSELTQIMAFLDRNCANFKEGEYLDMCNLLMSLHKKFVTPPTPVSVSFAATQPLPPVPVQVPFSPVRGRVFAPVSFVPQEERVDLTGDYDEFWRYEEIEKLKKLLWRRMSESRKKNVMIGLLDHSNDWTCLFELERAVLLDRGFSLDRGENTMYAFEQQSFLTNQYKLAFLRHNNEIKRQIKVHTDILDAI